MVVCCNVLLQPQALYIVCLYKMLWDCHKLLSKSVHLHRMSQSIHQSSTHPNLHQLPHTTAINHAVFKTPELTFATSWLSNTDLSSVGRLLVGNTIPTIKYISNKQCRLA